MAKDILSLDFETYCDLNLTDVGVSRYSRHESAEVLMGAYALNQAAVRQYVPAEGEPMPKHLRQAIDSPDVEKWVWNAPFEMNMLRNTLGIPVDIRQWRCTMVQALHCSLPGKLEKAGPVVGLPMEMQKDRRGKALMRKFSIPRKPTARRPELRTLWHEALEEWIEYKEYNVSDVVAERGIRNRLWPFRMSDDEWEWWFVDQAINEAGIPINLRMVRNAIRTYEDVLGRSLDEMKEITGLENPNSLKQLLPWLNEQGYPFDNCRKASITTALDYFRKQPDHWDDETWQAYTRSNGLGRVLELRAETSRTSIKKYYALDRATDEDGHLRNTLQTNGAARTGREAGRIFQPQNLPRPEKRFEPIQPQLADAIENLDADGVNIMLGNPFDVLASGIRTAAQAPEGMVFLDADLSAIENVVLGWLAECPKILRVFEDNLDPYISFAHYLFDRPYEELWHEYKVLGDSSKRTISKPGTLGCGYGMGPGRSWVNPKNGEIEASGLLGYAWGMGVKHFTQRDAEHSVKTFRSTYSEVKDYWYDLERTARRCVKTQKPQRCGVIRFDYMAPFMRMILPSGRPLYYCRPRLEHVPVPWGGTRLQITYENLDERKQWKRTHTTPGKITENADQAIARDLLVHGIKKARAEGFDIRLHVHDQNVALAPEEGAEEALAALIECMTDKPDWAQDLPLAASGQITKVFMKD